MFVYAVFQNSDKIEGRGHEELVALFSDDSEAHNVAGGRGGMGQGSGDVKSLPVFNTAAEFNAAAREQEKQNALAKLSRRERELLDL